MSGPARRAEDGPSRGLFAVVALLLTALLAYSSAMLAVRGSHFVWIPPEEALRRLLDVRWIEYGSDQRADWMANLIALVPIGYCWFAALVPRRGVAGVIAGVAATVVIGIAIILGVKFAQLYRPPRTVTLNYIVAQCGGFTVGMIANVLFAAPLARAFATFRKDSLPAVTTALTIYAVLLLIFYLSPFDFAVTAQDWSERPAVIRETVFSLPGEGRPAALRLMLLAAGALIPAPIGMLAQLRRPRLGVLGLAGIGVLLMGLVLLLWVAMVSGRPSLPTLAYRAAGVVCGGLLVRWLRRADLARIRRALVWLLVPGVPGYLMTLVYINNLVSTHWYSLEEAIRATDWVILQPFYLFYIVAKSQALLSVVVHIGMYAPIGVMFWLAGWERRGHAWLAALLAVVASTAIEVARWMRPGLGPDINELLLSGIGAWAAVRVLPLFWHALGEFSHSGAAPAPEPAPASSPPSVIRATPLAPPMPGGAFGPIPLRVRPSAGGALASLIALAGAVALLCLHPVAPVMLSLAFLAYAAALWRWPFAWLLVIPVGLPCLNLAPWTGWVLAGEADILVLVTLAVLAWRRPPGRQDWRIPGHASWVLGFAIAAWLVALLTGAVLPVKLEAESANVYLSGWNAIRVGKGFLTALALLPFVRQSIRAGEIALLGTGIRFALVAIAVIVIAERAVFSALFDFASPYRVAGPFASMHIGGGHIGTFVAMALPFLASGRLRRGAGGIVLTILAGVLGGYTLVVTFARTAYGASLAAVVTTAIAGFFSRKAMPRTVPVVLLLVIAGAIVAAATTTQFMSSRLEQFIPDARVRMDNWRRGLTASDHSPRTALIGMGLGTYPGAAHARISNAPVPTNYTVTTENGRTFVSAQPTSAFYFGQKIDLPDAGGVHVILLARPIGGPASVTVLLCAKWLLYSDDCLSTPLALPSSGTWSPLILDLAEPALTALRRADPFRRPVEFSIAFDRTRWVDVTAIALRDDAGHDLLANGNFVDGTAHWFFTDDDHIAWRIMNQYLMTWFETGALGCLALAALMVGALLGALQDIRRGGPLGAGIAGAIVAFLVAGISDSLIEVPAIASLFYLLAFTGLAFWRSGTDAI